LHRGLLDDFKFSRLPIASKALAPLLWLLASEFEDGVITYAYEEIAFRLRISEDELTKYIKPLIDINLFITDSAMLAPGYQHATPETEGETEGETDSCAVRKRTRTKLSYDSKFEEAWQGYPKRDGGNPKPPAAKRFLAALKAGADADEIITAIKRYAIAEQKNIGTPYIPQMVKWLRDQRWLDYGPDCSVVKFDVRKHLV
jgi:hypothetical protein